MWGVTNMFFDPRNRFVGFFFCLEGALTLFSATSILARDIIMCYVTKNLCTQVWASSKNSSPVHSLYPPCRKGVPRIFGSWG